MTTEKSDTLILYRIPGRSTEHLLTLLELCNGLSQDETVRVVLQYCEDPEVQMLLWSSNREFARSLRANDLSTSQIGSERYQIARAMVGYLSRMSTRCTPLGLLGGIGWGRAGKATNLTVSAVEPDMVVASLSPFLGMKLLPQFGRHLGEEYTNPTIYQVHGRTRWYQIVDEGTWRLSEAKGAVGDEVPYTAPLSPTEPSCVEDMLLKATRLPSAHAFAASKVLETAQQLNGRLGPEWPVKYDNCVSSIDGLLGMVAPEVAATRKCSDLVLCTRVSSGTVTIREDLLDEIRVAASIVHRFFDKSLSAPLLTSFYTRFASRYGDSFVPLLEAIDPGCGIGYLNAAGLSLDVIDGYWTQQTGESYTGNTVLSELLVAAATSNKQVLEIDPEWADSGLDDKGYTVLGSMARDNRFLLDVVSVGDERLLGRFAPDVPGLAEALKDRISVEEREADTVDAEVIYVSPSPDVNVTRRSAIFDHEIICFGRASRNTTAIPVNELWIGIDQGRLRLWWPRAECWVRPHYGCAHNVEMSTYPVYRILADLTRLHSVTFGWSWGQLSKVRRFPAVSCGQVQLCSRCWWLHGQELDELQQLAIDERIVMMREIREELDIPRQVQAGLLDKFIEIDLENPVFVDAMLHKIRHSRSLILRESRMRATNVILRGHQSYCNEMAIRFSPKSSLPRRNQPKPRKLSKARLKGPPSKDWVTLKIYDERIQLETLLVEKLVPWIEEKVMLGFADKWHFLRYQDPRDHLRFRFASVSATALPQLVGEAYKLLNRMDISIDGYFPEVSRYGGKLGMEICESVFMSDSRVAAEIIETLPAELAVKRWEFSLGVLDNMMAAADIPLASRIDLCAAMRDGYAGKAGLDSSHVRRRLDSGYRARRGRVEQAIATTREMANGVGYEDIVELKQLDDTLDLPVIEVVSSLMHMHLNRMLGVSQMAQEVAIYDYLRRYYRSEVARLPRPKAGK